MVHTATSFREGKTRISSEDRAKEILERYKSPTQSLVVSSDKSLPMTSLKSQWDVMMKSDALDEIDSPGPIEKGASSSFSLIDGSSTSSCDPNFKNQKKNMPEKYFKSQDFDSSNDSLDISETDLQVRSKVTFCKEIITNKSYCAHS